MVLERTKSTGPGKRVGHLHAMVARGAYYRHPEWLATGFALRTRLLQDIPFAFPVPSRDLHTAVPAQADYADAVAASHGLCALLVGPGGRDAAGDECYEEDEFMSGRRLLPSLSGGYWTEHSERNALPTLAAALGLKPEVIRRLGRWQVKDTSEDYARSDLTIVAEAQHQVARRVRRGGQDFVGEVRELERFARYLRAKGHPDAVVELARRRLTYFGGGDAGTPTKEDEEEEAGGAPTTPAIAAELADLGQEAAGVGTEPGEASEVEEEGLTGYIVSIVGRRRFRRLHHLMKCGLIPGRDYHDFVMYGESLPDPSEYDAICSRCWRSPSAFAAEHAAAGAADSGTATSSGESESERGL